MRWAWIVAGLALAGAGCSAPEPEAYPLAADTWSADDTTWGRDPVLGRWIPINTAAGDRLYRGTRYYFADVAEMEKFDANPYFYVQNSSPRLSSDEPAEKSPSVR